MDQEAALDLDRSCIRVLTLLRGAAGDHLKLDPYVVDLDEGPSFEALSYVWGDPSDTRPVWVGGETFDITVSLYDFLRCLRDEVRDRVIWADAICIDQQSSVEKRHQIGLMGRIYSQAQETHIWFGDPSESWRQEMVVKDHIACGLRSSHTVDDMVEDAVDVVEFHRSWLHPIHKPGDMQLLYALDPRSYELIEAGSDTADTRATMSFERILGFTLDVLDDLVSTPRKHLWDFPLFCWKERLPDPRETAPIQVNAVWPYIADCLHWLLSRDWWSRVWTIQEAALPKGDPLIHIGSLQFRLSRITKACQELSSHVQACCRKYKRVWLAETSAQRNEFMHAAIIQTFRQRLSKDRREGISYEDAVRICLARQVSVVQDRIFGVLGLLRDSRDGRLRQLGYSSDFATLYSQFTRACYDLSGSLDALWLANRCREAASITTAPCSLPSWAIDFGRARPLSGATHLTNSTSHYRWNLFEASLKYKHEKVAIDSTHPSHLLVRVFHISGGLMAFPKHYHPNLQTIDRVNNLKDLYRRSGHYDEDKFWRTVLMDRNVSLWWRHKRERMPAKRLEIVKRWWAGVEKSKGFEGTEADAVGSWRGTLHKTELEFNLDNYRFFCTEKGDPGMADLDVEPYDQIYVMAGSSSPVLLRPVSSSSLSSPPPPPPPASMSEDESLPDTYRIVGFCFVDGYMYGEALAKVPDPCWQTVHLV